MPRVVVPYEQIPAALFNDPNINANDFRVMCELYRCNSLDKGCFPKQKYLAQKCGLGVRSIQNVIRKLRDLRWITTEKPDHSGPLHFILQNVPPAKSDTTPPHETTPPPRTKRRSNNDDLDERDSSNEPPVVPQGDGWDEEEAKRELNKLADCMKVSLWLKITKARLTLLRRRFKEQSSASWASFWREAEKAAQKVDPSQWEQDWWNLEVFLRVPQRGGIDHFQRAEEGHYSKPRHEKKEWESYLDGNGTRRMREKTADVAASTPPRILEGLNYEYEDRVLKIVNAHRPSLTSAEWAEVYKRWAKGERGDRG